MPALVATDSARSQVDPARRPTLESILREGAIAAHVADHEHVARQYAAAAEGACVRQAPPRQPPRRSPSRHTRAHRSGHVAQVEIPLVGYDGCSKTRFSERPTFLEGGRRIVDGAQLSNHDRKLLAARERRRLATGRSSDPVMPAAHGQGGAHSGSAGSDLLAKRWSASDLSASLNRDSR